MCLLKRMMLAFTMVGSRNCEHSGNPVRVETFMAYPSLDEIFSQNSEIPSSICETLVEWRSRAVGSECFDRGCGCKMQTKARRSPSLLLVSSRQLPSINFASCTTSYNLAMISPGIDAVSMLATLRSKIKSYTWEDKTVLKIFICKTHGREHDEDQNRTLFVYWRFICYICHWHDATALA